MLFNRQKRNRLTASVLTFVMLFQTIAGVFAPVNIFNLQKNEAHAGWFGNDWGYRKEIKVDHTKVSNTDQAYFPMLVSLTDPALKTVANGGKAQNPAGNLDLMFTAVNGTTKLDHEIEKYVAATGELRAWVKIPSLSTSVDTSIYIYYGNSAIAASQENKAGVWDDGGGNNFKMVQHMNQDPGSASPQMTDSTGYANNGTSNGTMTSANQVAGMVDGATSFDGADDYIDAGSGAALNITGAVTVSAWVKSSAITTYQHVASKGGVGVDDYETAIYHSKMYSRFNIGNVLYNAEGNTALTDNTWYYLSYRYDGSSLDYVLNGQIDKTTAASGSISTLGSALHIGREVAFSAFFNGTIDEVRVSNVARSNDWIVTEYKNQSNPTEFYSVGIEEVATPAALSTFGYRKAITIDHTKVSGDLVNFPVLINLPTDASLAAHAQADADDILFASSGVSWTTGTVNDKLAHEVETYTAANGSLQAWVKIPNLSATTDTVIYMYYGNGSVVAQQNKTAVWDTNTKMVQHMNQTGTGAAGDYKDSTQFANNSTNTTNQPTVTSSGQIGKAENFDGTGKVSLGNVQMTNAEQMTFSCWFSSTFNSQVQTLLSHNGQSSPYIWLFLSRYGADSIGTQFFTDGGISGGYVNFNYSGLGLVKYDLTINESSNTATIYRNGVVVGTSPHSGAIIIPDQYRDTTIGSFTGGGNYLVGTLDEVRISSIARSASWIATEYSNQSKPAEFSTLGIEEVSAPSALSSFGYRKAITIDHTKVSGDLVNFPVLINLPTDASLAAHAQADGDDILFTSSTTTWNTGTTNNRLAHEIETYTTATGSLQAWVKIPNLSSTVDTVIYMYYGNGSVTSQQSETAVWDSNTKMVQHLAEAPANGAAGHLDSTQYANNGTPQNFDSIATSTTNGVGQIDGADVFDGTNDYINNGSSRSLDIASSVTVSAWIKPSATLPDEAVLVRKGADDCGNYNLQIKSHKLAFLSSSKCGWAYAGANSTIADGVWQYVTVTADGSNLKYFINGSNTDTVASWSVGSTLSNPLTIGGYASAIPADTFNGTIDEVRIASTARSASWIATEYNNQSKPTEFSFLGIEEVSSPAALSSFGYRKAITIDHTKVSGDLMNFPVLINLPTDASLAAHAQSDGDDILFTSSATAWNAGTTNDRLAHEIETYTTVTGSLQAWVKIPNLSSTVDTVIYMYYGNATVTSQQNKTAVWDTNTTMVQHMNQTGTGAVGDYKDSTQFANNSYSVVSQPTVTSSGKIGSAESFNSTSQYISVNDSAAIRPANNLTFGAWINPSVVGGYILDKSTAYNGYGLTTSGTQFLIQVAGWSNIGVTGPNEIANTWQYVVVTYERPNVYFYYNGVRYGPFSRDAAIESSGNPLVVGGSYSWQAADGYQPRPSFSGSIDEVRVSNIARSAQWIATEYNNQSKPTEFSTLGIEEVSSPAALSSFGYRRAITIDHTKVSGAANLSNFPVLINLPTDASLQAHAQNDGDDILFTSSATAWDTGTTNDKLAHEIETYTAATGSLQAWVKIPQLSPAVDTVIYMYYGNGSIATQQNKIAVWDANTKMVQHMNQTGTGAAGDYRDSTQYANHSINTAKQPTAVGGQVDGAESFDGVEDYLDLGNRSSLDTPDMLTVEAWAKPNAGYGLVAPRIIEKTLSYIINMDLAGRVSGFAFIGGVQRGTTATSNIPVDSWSHIVYSIDTNTGNCVLYINGSVSNTRSYAGKIDTSINTVKIGDSSGAGARNFTGSIDEVRISNTARPAAWIATEYNNQSNPSAFAALGSEQIYRLEITGSANQTSGQSQTITLTAKNAAGNTMAGYNGDATVVFSGASSSPRGTGPRCQDKNGNYIALGSPTTLTFTSGVATSILRLYKAESAVISASGISTSSGNLPVTVIPNLLDNFLVDAPASSASGVSFAATITARDYYYNPLTSFSGTTSLTVNTGSITPASISSGSFTNGVWSGSLTVADITEQPSVSITANLSGHVGSDSISILGIPADPANASASRNSDNSITVTWQDASTVESGYTIERKMDDGSGFGAYFEIGSVSANVSAFTDDAASNPADMPIPDRRYQYRVRAVGAMGNSAAYSEDPVVHYTTPDTPANVFGSYLSDSSFRLSYTDRAAVTDTHRLERCSNANCGTTYETSLGVFASSPQTDSTSIYPDSRYRWQVRAEAPNINSDYEVSNFEYTTPTAPTIGTTAYVSASELTVNWSDTSAYEDGFRLEVSTDGGAYAEVTPGTNTVGAGITSYTFAAQPDHSYRFRVRSHIGATPRNAALLSAYSGESSAVYTVAGPPTMQAPVATSAQSITWSWLDNSSFEENFHLHFTTGAGSDVNDIVANSTSYATAGLLPNSAYQTHVHSYRSDTGESDPSAASTEIYTLANPPANLNLTVPTQNRIRAAWDANQNPAGTEYYLENLNTGETSGWTTASAWSSGELECGVEYSFRVKARNHDNAETAYAAPVAIKNSSCGAGLPLGSQNPPVAPQITPDNPTGAFQVLIDGGNGYTKNTEVKLSLFAGSDTTRMAVANSRDFSAASLVPYQEEVRWDLVDRGQTSQLSEVRPPDGTYTVYVRFYTKYGVASPTVSDTITLDTTAPTLDLVNLKDKYLTTDSITIRGTTEAGSKVIYNLDSQRAGVIDIAADGKLILNLGALAPGTHSLKLVAQDSLGNSSDTMQFFLNVEKPTTIEPAPTPTHPVTPQPNTPTQPGSAPTVTTPTSTAPQVSTPQPGIDVPAIDTPGMDDPRIDNPDLGAPIVTPQAPASLQGEWNLLEVKPIPQEMTPEDIEMIVAKFPEFKETFRNLGINDFQDADRLQNVSLNLPNLSEVMGLNPTELTTLNLPPANTPLTELSASFKQGIPSNIVFVKTKDSNLDVSSALTFENGNPDQKISLLSGRSFQLVLRPDQDVNSVQGYITFRESRVSRADDTHALTKVARLLGLHRSALAEEKVEEKLVLSEFEYRDDDQDGLWTADITTPQVSGEYELITVLNYKDIKLGAKTLRLITVVDPEGYVYRMEVDGIEARIPNATISLYWFNGEAKQYELWDAQRYQQQNPQTTDQRGTYSFLVPPGSYYLKAEAAGYATFQSEPFDVAVGSGVHMNLELRRQADWRDQLNWQNLLLVVFGVALFYNFYSDRKERKKRRQERERELV